MLFVRTAVKRLAKAEANSMTNPQTSDTLRQWRDSAPFWAKHRATICTMFAPLTEALIADTRIEEGHSVLDVAGGPGEPSLTIAQTVGDSGSVTCTDAIAEMVETAEAEAHARGLTNMTFRQCTAESLPFPDNSFARVVSRLGAMFFPDEAFGEILRVAKPGARVGFVVWDKSELNPFFYLITNVISRYAEVAPVDPNAPGAFRFAEEGKLAAALKDAGAIHNSERILKFDIEAPLSREEFWEIRSGTSDTLRAKLATLSESDRLAVADEIKLAVQDYFPNNQMKFPAQARVVTASKPT
jgi:ubiquinone/menaquinone biosynthesis C-methylase UbiE